MGISWEIDSILLNCSILLSRSRLQMSISTCSATRLFPISKQNSKAIVCGALLHGKSRKRCTESQRKNGDDVGGGGGGGGEKLGS